MKTGELLETSREALHSVERIAGILGSARLKNPDVCVLPWADLGDVFSAAHLAVKALGQVVPILERMQADDSDENGSGESGSAGARAVA